MYSESLYHLFVLTKIQNSSWSCLLIFIENWNRKLCRPKSQKSCVWHPYIYYLHYSVCRNELWCDDIQQSVYVLTWLYENHQLWISTSYPSNFYPLIQKNLLKWEGTAMCRVFSNMSTCIYTNTVIILSPSQLLDKVSLGMKMELTTILKLIFTCISYTVLGSWA